jgi:hypothetical protein
MYTYDPSFFPNGSSYFTPIQNPGLKLTLPEHKRDYSISIKNQ